MRQFAILSGTDALTWHMEVARFAHSCNLIFEGDSEMSAPATVIKFWVVTYISSFGDTELKCLREGLSTRRL